MRAIAEPPPRGEAPAGEPDRRAEEPEPPTQAVPLIAPAGAPAGRPPQRPPGRAAARVPTRRARPLRRAPGPRRPPSRFATGQFVP